MDFNSGKEGRPVALPKNDSVSEMQENPDDHAMPSMLSDEGNPVSNPTPNTVANHDIDTIAQGEAQMGSSDVVRRRTPDINMSVNTVTQASTDSSSVSVVKHYHQYHGPVYKDIKTGDNAHFGNVVQTAHPASSGDRQAGLLAVTNSPTQKDANMDRSLACLEENIKQCLKDELYETRKEMRKLKTDHKTSHCEMKDYIKQIVSHSSEDRNRVQQILGDIQQNLKQNEDENRGILSYITSIAAANNIRLDDLSKRTGQLHATTQEMRESQKRMEVHCNLSQARDHILMKDVKEVKKSQMKLESDVQHTQNQSLQNTQMILDHSQSTDEKMTQFGKKMENLEISTSKNTDETYHAAALASSVNAKLDVMHEQVTKNEEASKAQGDKIAVLEEKVGFNDPDPQGFKTPFFRENGQFLINHVKADGLLIKMFSSVALTGSEMYAIKKDGSQYDKVARLLAILDKKADGVNLLLQGLRDDGQDVVVASLE